MKNIGKRLVSICLCAALVISGNLAGLDLAYAKQTDAKLEVLDVRSLKNNLEDSNISTEIKGTDIDNFNGLNFDESKLNVASSKEIVGESAVVTYFKNEYYKAINMQGTRTDYYAIDTSSYTLTTSSADLNTMLQYMLEDIYSDYYDSDYNVCEYKYPNRFHMKGKWELYGNANTGKVNEIRILYSDYAQYFKYNIDKVINCDKQIRARISSSMTVDEMILVIHDAIITELTFAYNEYINQNGNYFMYHQAWGTMAGRKGLCDAFAYILKYYLDCITVNNVHIKNRVVYSSTLNHMWNMVELNGKWYHIDAAWDGLVVKSNSFTGTFSNVANKVTMYNDYNPDYEDEGYVGHAYFMKTDSEMKNYGYSNWTAYFLESDGLSSALTPTSSSVKYSSIAKDVKGNMPFAYGYWYIPPASGNAKYFTKTKYNGTGRTTISTAYNVRYLQTDGTYLYYTDGKKLVRTDLNGKNTTVANVAASNQNISEFAIINGNFVYKLISGYTVQSVEKAKSNIKWESSCSHTYKWVVKTKASLTKDGLKTNVCSKCGHVKSTSVIKRIKTISLSTSLETYNGKAKKPSVKVIDSAGSKISSSNYSLSYNNNIKIGTAKVTVTFKGSNYSGSKTIKFTIGPAGTSISSIKGFSKGFEIRWKLQKVQTNGYEIQFSTNKKFPVNKTKSTIVSKTSLTSGRAKGLKGNATYYIRIRTYKNVGGKKIFSKWSKTVSVKTKG